MRRPRAAYKIDLFLVYLQGRASSAQLDWLPATVLFHDIHVQGYEGEVKSATCIFAHPKANDLGQHPLVRFETAPNQQMQADGLSKPRLSAFVATLGDSRRSFVDFVSDERIDSLLACHAHAFDFFDG